MAVLVELALTLLYRHENKAKNRLLVGGCVDSGVREWSRIYEVDLWGFSGTGVPREGFPGRPGSRPGEKGTPLFLRLSLASRA